NNYKRKSIQEIIDIIKKEEITLIIDGLDHVENYNPRDMDLFIDFITKLGKLGTVIVLSRPLRTKVEWKKEIIHNWNFEQTG
ncbi:hypothetical protein R0J90_20420, partial [Micrococcus sp. SIMBA_144]